MFRMMYRIAKVELQMLFFSPIAWLILVLFAIQSAFLFTDMMNSWVVYQEMGKGIRRISLETFGGWQGVFTVMKNYLYFYIPLLTMSLVSRELSSGSIKLLYSSPITNTHIILGKFLSMVIYGIVMMGVLLPLIFCAWFTIKDFDWPAILTGLLGLYLLTCAYSAIGIFMSSLTSYQIVAAIGTLVVLMGLNSVGNWWQEYDLIRDITYWLAINGRCEQFITGLICSEDVLYFFIVIVLFLALAIIRLNAVRQKIRFIITVSNNILVIFLACALGYFSSLPKLMWYYDATETKMNTLTKNSQEIVAKLDGAMTITTYVNLLDADTWFATYGFMKPDMDRFKQYVRFKPDIKLKYVYYYDKTDNPRLDKMFPNLNDRERMIKLCEMYRLDTNRFKSPEEMSKIIDLASEGKTFIRQIVRENGQKAWLRIYNDMMRFPSEREITAAFKRMVMELPKVGILQGHGERSIRNLKDVSYSLFANDKKFRYALMNQGFDIEEVVLDKAIPESIKILVIADMRESLKPEEEMNLQQYINRGGNLFILGEPRRREKMNPLFAKFGFELMPGVLVKQDTNRQADMLLSYPTKEARSIAYEFGSLYDYAYVITTPSVAGLRQLEDRGFEVTELFKSDTVGSWNELETTDFIDDTISLNPLIGEVERSYPTIIALSRKVGDKEQKIILAGDADCISNGEFSRGGIRASNYTLITAGFFWLSDNEVPIDIRRPEFPDNKLYMGPVGERITKILFLYVLPCLLFGIGIFVWIRRKGR